jgi:hypothetical protein
MLQHLIFGHQVAKFYHQKTTFLLGEKHKAAT